MKTYIALSSLCRSIGIMRSVGSNFMVALAHGFELATAVAVCEPGFAGAARLVSF